MSKPKFTIVIPTRERADVLFASLLTAVKQDYDNLEIIVSDNFSSDNTEDVVRSFSDSRVRYINTGKRLSMSHNWEFALSHITEGWITFLGDDDGILPGALNKVVEIIHATGTDAIRSNVCSYAWPSLTGTNYGRLSVSLQRGYEIRMAKDWLNKVMAGHQSYTSLPMLYNGGFVNFELIKKVKSKVGCFYLSRTPDIYSAIVFASLLDTYVYSHEPFAINGASQHSGGTSAFVKNGLKTDGPSSAKKFMSEPNISSHPDIPMFPDGTPPLSIQATVYECYLQTQMFRDKQNELVSHEQQLEIILRNAGRHHETVTAWGKLFADKHQLDFESIYRESQRTKRTNYVQKIKKRLSSLFHQHSDLLNVGSDDLPIKDVYEASIVAAALKSIKPSRLTERSQMLRRVIRKAKYLLIRLGGAKAPKAPNLAGDRDIEWSWVASKMPSGPGEALDFGPGGSCLGLIAAQRGFNVTAVDMEPVRWAYLHPRLRFIQGDILNLSLPKEHFDLVINCSTVEHVGLVGRYGVTESRPNGDLEAMAHLRELVKPGGIMLLSIPIGSDVVFTPLHRVYGPERLPMLIDGYIVEREEYWVKNNQNDWVLIDKQHALAREPQERLYGLGCFVLRRPRV